MQKYQEDDEDCVLCTTINKTTELSQPIKDVKGLVVCTEDFRTRFFEQLLTSRVKIINGIPTSSEEFIGAVSCDYCRHGCDGEFYFRCKECLRDMCQLCKEETSEEIAIQNGAQSYAQRAEKLQLCQQQHTLRRIEFIELQKEDNGDGTYPYDQCFKYWDQLQYGSVLDWIPVYRDEEYNMVLVNRYEGSPYFNQVSMCSQDNHGRCGFFTLPNVEYNSPSYDALLAQLETFHDNPLKDEDGNELKGWDRVYNLPIKRVMDGFGMQTHYG